MVYRHDAPCRFSVCWKGGGGGGGGEEANHGAQNNGENVAQEAFFY